MSIAEKLQTVADNEQRVFDSGRDSVTWQDRLKELIDFRNASYLFVNKTTIKTAPIKYADTSNATDMEGMFKGCSSLIAMPSLNTQKVLKMANMFAGCTALTAVASYDTRNVTVFSNMFGSCSSLTQIPKLDLRSAVSVSGMLGGCKALKTVDIVNIRVSLQVASGSSYGHLITQDSLLHLIKEVIKGDSAIKLTVGAANLNKLAGVYVRLVDVTNAMRAQDDLIDLKYPFEVCQSTDTGAMSIEEYASMKNLTLL
ncbi:MAG: BspA family leucine-rich repeat surface protein [Clostridia bacterium]|nr:BspA family leucine-rich repeat surface protein [Clostridia bacterium]